MQTTELVYQIRSGPHPCRVENFRDPEDAARHWHGLNDPLARLFVMEEGGRDLSTPANVAPVYDALAKMRES